MPTNVDSGIRRLPGGSEECGRAVILVCAFHYYESEPF